MARTEARLLADFFERLSGATDPAKLLYCALLIEPTLNHAGVAALRISRWAKQVGHSTDRVTQSLTELDAGRWALVDWDTEEVLVRTIIRRDGVADQPNVLWSACRAAGQVHSAKLRRVLAEELRKLPPRRPDKQMRSGRVYVHADPHAVADQIDPGSPPEPSTRPDRDGLATESPNGSAEGCRNPSKRVAEGFSKGSARGRVLEEFEKGRGIGEGDRGGGVTFSGTHLERKNQDLGAAENSSPDRERGDWQPPPIPDRREPAVTGPTAADAYRLVDSAIGREHPHTVRTALAIEVQTLIHSGHPTELVTAALGLWLAKPSLGPRTLPSLVSEALRARAVTRRVSTTDRRIAEAELLKDHPDPAVLAAGGLAPPVRLRALPGGAA